MSTETRINAGKRADFTPGSLKEVPVGEGDKAPKVLLATLADGTINAISSKCTHYGAPLAKGILAADGCITCPWHGAKFQSKTGDIEDAPGLNALHSFKVEIEGDNVFVNVDKSLLEQNGRKPKVSATLKKRKADPEAGIVCVGGGAGSNMAAQALREIGYSGELTIISSEPYLPIDRTKLSKALIDDPAKVALRDQAWFDEQNITVRTGTGVKSVDIKQNAVMLEDGTPVPYTKLILATGSSPSALPLEGKELGNIFLLRTIEHTKAINAAVGDGKESKKNVVVIGTSWIGCESALALSDRANVHVVGMDKAPFQKILGEEVGTGLRKAHESKKGIKFTMEAAISHYVPSKSDKSKVGAVALKDGTELPADVVIVGAGVKPRTEYLKDVPGLELNKDGSVNVDVNFVVEGIDASNVYAIGDIASYIDGNTKERYRIEHWNVASNHGRAVAQNMFGTPKPFDKIPYFWSAEQGQLRYAGTSQAPQWDDCIVRGKSEELKFSSYYFKGDKVVAVASMGVDPLVSQCAELFRLGAMPSAQEIRDGRDPLDISVMQITASA